MGEAIGQVTRSGRNVFALGVAYKSGLLSIEVESIEAAIRVYRVGFAPNLNAFPFGRLGIGLQRDRARDLPKIPVGIRYEEIKPENLRFVRGKTPGLLPRYRGRGRGAKAVVFQQTGKSSDLLS